MQQLCRMHILAPAQMCADDTETAIRNIYLLQHVRTLTMK